MFISNVGSLFNLKFLYKKNNFPDKDFEYFTYSREALIEILKSNDISDSCEVLLPNYLCSNVIESILPNTKKISFYKINDNLTFNEEEIIKLITQDTKMIIFVDYFGFQTKISNHLELKLKSKKIIIVKDSAHAYLSLVNTNFSKDYNYDYIFSSIYKNLPTQVGSIAFGEFNQRHKFINFFIFIKRFFILFLKNLLCILGLQNHINKGISNITISSEAPKKYVYGINCYNFFSYLINKIDYERVICQRKKLFVEYEIFFKNKDIGSPIYSSKYIGQNVLQSYPILFKNKNQRDLILNILAENSIDAYTWPTFHRLNSDQSLWERVLLLPFHNRVLKILSNV